jgi:hypothetical protein
MWQTSGRNDGEVRRQAVTSGELPHQTHLRAVALRTSNPSRSRNQFIDPGGTIGLVYLSICLSERIGVDTLLKDVMHCCVVPSSGDEPATTNLESDVLTTRPTRLTQP